MPTLRGVIGATGLQNVSDRQGTRRSGPGVERRSRRWHLPPCDFLDRLADLVPPPRKQRNRHHGVFAMAAAASVSRSRCMRYQRTTRRRTFSVSAATSAWVIGRAGRNSGGPSPDGTKTPTGAGPEGHPRSGDDLAPRSGSIARNTLGGKNIRSVLPGTYAYLCAGDTHARAQTVGHKLPGWPANRPEPTTLALIS